MELNALAARQEFHEINARSSRWVMREAIAQCVEREESEMHSS